MKRCGAEVVLSLPEIPSSSHNSLPLQVMTQHLVKASVSGAATPGWKGDLLPMIHPALLRLKRRFPARGPNITIALHNVSGGKADSSELLEARYMNIYGVPFLLGVG